MMESDRMATVDDVREFLQDIKKNVNRLCIGHSFGSMQQATKGLPSENGILDKATKAQGRFSTQGFKENKTCSSCSSEKMSSCTEAGKDFGVFLEDMRKTIEAWCSRFNLLVEGNFIQYGRRLLIPSCGVDSDRVFSSTEALEKSNERQSDAVYQSPMVSRKGKVFAFPGQLSELNSESTKPNRIAGLGELECKINNPQMNSEQVDMGVAFGSSSHLTNSSDDSRQYGEDSVANERQRNAVYLSSMVSHKGKLSAFPGQLSERNSESTKPNRIAGLGELECRINNPQMDGEQVDMGVAFGSRSHLTNSSDDSHQYEEDPVANAACEKERLASNGTEDLTIRRIEPKVEVVESPDWLPKGWITEVKTRISGGSAGCKDKFYYDPVSKRRCRSQKEVFSLLSTGKLGRYKKRPKFQSQMKQTETDTAQQQNLTAVEYVGKKETSAMGSTGLSHHNTRELASPLAFPHVGGKGLANNNMFLPHRPGQPSEWLVYESLANVPRPMLERFQLQDDTANKLHGERNSTYSRPMFFVASETSVRPFADKADSRKTTENGVFVGGEFAGRQPDAKEVVPKRSRKSVKRATVVFS